MYGHSLSKSIANFYGIENKMVIKIRKINKGKECFQYKSSRRIITPHDKKEADEFDLNLRNTINNIEKILINSDALSKKNKKKDPILVWYTVGEHINNFLKKHPFDSEDENLFWNYLYGSSPLIHKGIPSNKVSKVRNDFKTASLLAQYPIKIIRKVGVWSLWREIIGYRIFLGDKRVIEYVIKEFIKKPRNRDEARVFLQTLAQRLKKIDTSILDDKELTIVLRRK